MVNLKYVRTDADTAPGAVQPLLVNDPVPIDHGGTGATDAPTAKSNFGLGSAADKAISDFLQAVNNLSDLVSAASARSNLGLGSVATHAITELLQSANNLADLASASAARINLGLGSIATHPSSDYLAALNNLSEITNAATARLNLGLGSASTKASTDFLQTINNLSDLISQATARANLGLGNVDNTSDLNKPISTATQTALNGKEFTITAGTTAQYYRGDKTWQTLPTMPSRSFNNSPGRSIVTGTGATGFQISNTRDAMVNYSVTITTAVQIGVITNVDGYVVLEIAPTNSAISGDWVEIARTPQAQNIGLALALSSTQKGGGNLSGAVPAGYYAKIRSVNTAGTPTYTMNSAQEVLL